jgi:hypothetical protein
MMKSLAWATAPASSSRAGPGSGAFVLHTFMTGPYTSSCLVNAPFPADAAHDIEFSVDDRGCP